MIGSTLELVKRRLNDDLGPGEAGDVVVFSNLTNHGGAPFSSTENKIVMMVTNIQSERLAVRSPRPKFEGASQPLLMDVWLLFLANFQRERSGDGLNVLFLVFNFFHKNPVFTESNLPGLEPSIDKLTFELVNLDMSELSALMEMIGARYVPSALYKVRAFPVGL